MPPTIARDELAALLGLDALARTTLRRKLAKLILRRRFPRPLPGLRVWSRPLVEAWIASNGAASAEAAPGRAYVEEINARLEARLARRA